MTYLLILKRMDGATSNVSVDVTEEVLDKTIQRLFEQMPEVEEIIKAQLIEVIQRTPLQ